MTAPIATDASTRDDGGDNSGARLASAVVATAVGLVLLAQFSLERWAEGTELHHWVQHGLIFLAGVCLGAGSLALYRAGQRIVGGLGTGSPQCKRTS